ncbi:hypothetical protein [Pseudomonas sp. NFACC45]|nr:hypothetical protein [Pseudomonas sp. NFACC45]
MTALSFFASKPAPTVDRILFEETQSTVGAGLLAKAVDQAQKITQMKV